MRNCRMIRSNYAARHSIPPGGAIPPGIRLGIGIGLGVGGLGDAGRPVPTFRPNVVVPSQLAEAKRGVLKEISRLNTALAGLAAEIRGDEEDEPFSYEVELILEHLQRLADAL